jgi:predicted PurR-regulated permease PerM
VAEFARRVLVVAAFVVLGLLLWRIADAVLLAFGAVMVAVLLRTAAEPLARRTPLPEGWAIAVVALLILAGLSLVALLAGAEVRAQVSDLARRLPDAWEALQERVNGTEYGELLLERAGDAAPDAGGVLAGITGAATSAAGALANLALVLFGGLYFAAQPGLYRAGLVKLVPPVAQESVAATLDAAGEALRLWLLS